MAACGGGGAAAAGCGTTWRPAGMGTTRTGGGCTSGARPWSGCGTTTPLDAAAGAGCGTVTGCAGAEGRGTTRGCGPGCCCGASCCCWTTEVASALICGAATDGSSLGCKKGRRERVSGVRPETYVCVRVRCVRSQRCVWILAQSPDFTLPPAGFAAPRSAWMAATFL